MTLDEAYHEALKKLKNPRIDEINVRILLCDINDLPDMTSFYIYKSDEVKDLRRFHELFDKFLKGEPIQYLLKKTNFYGYDFYVDHRVLIPRMESEEVISYAINQISDIFPNKKISIVDVCCGSGCLGITLARCFNAEKLYLSDISKDAIDVAKINLERNGIHGNLFIGNALDKIVENKIKCDVLIANPPYILKREEVDESAAKHEPHIALFANKKLSVYENIFKNIKHIANKPFLAVFEIGYDTRVILEKLIKKYFPKAHYEFLKDINGNFRIASIYLK